LPNSVKFTHFFTSGVVTTHTRSARRLTLFTVLVHTTQQARTVKDFSFGTDVCMKLLINYF